jgi:dCMP deaminase
MSWWDIARSNIEDSNCLRRKYSAIIVDKFDNLLSVGWNESPKQCETCSREGIEHNTGSYAECPSVHAEQMALLGIDLGKLHGATLYLVCDKEDKPEPCPTCQKLMDWCGVKLKEMERDD